MPEQKKNGGKSTSAADDFYAYGVAMFRATKLQSRLEKMSLDDAARTVKDAYGRVVGRNRRWLHNAVSAKGAELEVIHCYLANMTIDEAVTTMKDRYGVTLSRSAIGRFFRKLLLLGVAPPGTMNARAFIQEECG